MPDDGKRTEMVCTKVSERMALDLLHLASLDDRSVSDYLFRMLRAQVPGLRITTRQVDGGVRVWRVE